MSISGAPAATEVPRQPLPRRGGRLWLVPTAEVPLTNLHRDEILEPDALPLRYVAYTPCFRREKMSAGRDVRGIKRGHQFDKVEMYKLCAPGESDGELERLLGDAEETCRRLGLAYRVKSYAPATWASRRRRRTTSRCGRRVAANGWR